MIGMTNTVNGNSPLIDLYAQPQRVSRKAGQVSQGYVSRDVVTPKMDIQSMFKVMLQMMKMLQGMQGNQTLQGPKPQQSIFSLTANPSSIFNIANDNQAVLSSAPVSTPETSTVDSTALLFAMLLSQSGGMSSILPSLASGSRTTPSTPMADNASSLDLPLVTTPITTSSNPFASTTLPSTPELPINTQVATLASQSYEQVRNPEETPKPTTSPAGTTFTTSRDKDGNITINNIITTSQTAATPALPYYSPYVYHKALLPYTRASRSFASPLYLYGLPYGMPYVIPG